MLRMLWFVPLICSLPLMALAQSAIETNDLPPLAQEPAHPAAPPPAESAEKEVPEPVLTPQEKNDVLYVTGGVGTEEVEALKALQEQFNLRIVSSMESGEYVFGTLVSIYDAQGGLVFEQPLSGPYLYVRLPAGQYDVEAAQSGNIQKKNTKLKEKPGQKLHFAW